MFKKLFMLFLTVTATINLSKATKPTWPSIDLNSCCLYNTQFLKNYDDVKNHLIKAENFQEIKFKTSDDITLDGLYRQSKGEASCTVIASSGFYPGRQEGMSSLIALLPENANILFYNARGHGDSEGFLQFINFGNYGVHEYKDVLAAIVFAHEKDETAKKVLFGTCAGAFHCAHALVKMEEFEKANYVERFNIKGLIFDSGWAQVADVAVSAIDGHINKLFKKDTFANNIANSLVSGYRSRFVLPKMKQQDEQTCLLGKMKNIKIPVLFIHSKDDTYALFSDTEKLAKETPKAICWWIDEKQSSHANHILKLKDEYKSKLQNFIGYVLNV